MKCHKCGDKLTEKQIENCKMLKRCGVNFKVYCGVCYLEVDKNKKKHIFRKKSFAGG